MELGYCLEAQVAGSLADQLPRPFALQEYWSARAEKQEGAQGGASRHGRQVTAILSIVGSCLLLGRRFVGYSGAKKGVEIRLHGRLGMSDQASCFWSPSSSAYVIFACCLAVRKGRGMFIARYAVGQVDGAFHTDRWRRGQ